MARTREEQYILKLYEMALAEGDLSHPFDRYAVGTAIGVSFRPVNAMCNILLQANFLKKDEDLIYLTRGGIELAERLLDET